MNQPAPTHHSRSDNTASGIVVIVATVFAMSGADALVKYASATFPLWQIYVLRSLAVLAILAMTTRLQGGRRSFIWGNKRWAFLRGFLLALMYIGIYAAAPVLSLAVIAAALYTSPLFIALLSAWFGGEPVGWRRWSAIGIGFAGVIIILRPAADGFSFVALVPVGAALLYAMAAVVTRVKCREETPLALAMALNLSLLAVGLIASALIAIWHPGLAQASAYPFLLGPWVAMGAREWLILAALALLMVGISLGLAKAYQSAAPSIIATFDYSYLIFAAFWSYVVFDQAPDAATIIGMTLIAGAGMLTIERPGRHQ